MESRKAEDQPFDAGVSQIELIRVARKWAGKVGANAPIVETVGAESALTTEATADSTGYEQRAARQSWGRGLFLVV